MEKAPQRKPVPKTTPKQGFEAGTVKSGVVQKNAEKQCGSNPSGQR